VVSGFGKIIVFEKKRLSKFPPKPPLAKAHLNGTRFELPRPNEKTPQIGEPVFSKIIVIAIFPRGGGVSKVANE